MEAGAGSGALAFTKSAHTFLHVYTYSQRTETGRPSVPQGYPRVLCFRGGHCRGRVFPPRTPCPDSAAPRGARVLLARPAGRAKTVYVVETLVAAPERALHLSLDMRFNVQGIAATAVGLRLLPRQPLRPPRHACNRKSGPTHCAGQGRRAGWKQRSRCTLCGSFLTGIVLLTKTKKYNNNNNNDDDDDDDNNNNNISPQKQKQTKQNKTKQ